ncbi:craniofacial development protein 2 [Caerostris extrusa]|uniref:Craniofacial development protein 2 n=1 Tax=Caerostris extrusa TaxID=172846 RepID=A0AAV4PMX4_CAEEX|nr:craniofacial development protein 2 [Caerostris extrusa]
MRWTGNRMMDVQKHTICYSCHHTKHSFGTGFILNKKIKHLVMDFQAVSPRLCYLLLRGKFNNYSMINVHASTEEREDAEKDRFYEELDHLWERCPSHDV